MAEKHNGYKSDFLGRSSLVKGNWVRETSSPLYNSTDRYLMNLLLRKKDNNKPKK
jgi:hypothetical protein